MGNTNIYITVLMPAYNAEAYINEAIESILTQTYSHFEFLIIDDGSTDNTPNIIRSYHDPRIRLICHENNMGIKNVLNEGIELSSNELIARMDADDISHPWRLEKQVDYLLKHPDCAMVSSRAKVIDKERNFKCAYDPYKMDPYYALNFDCYICHPTVVFRKSCVQAVGQYSMEFSEDFDLWWKLSRVYRIHILEEPLLLYRIHDQNYSKVKKRIEYDNAEQEIVKRNFQYLLGKNIQVPEAFVSCYNYDPEPLLQHKNPDEIIQCIDLLDLITNRIIAIENPNRNIGVINYFANAKKKKILYDLGMRLPLFQMLRLLLHYKQYKLTSLLFIKKARQHIKRKIKIILSCFNKER